MSPLTSHMLLVLLLCCIQLSEESVILSSRVQDENSVDGNRRKFIINLQSDEQNSGSPAMDDIGKRFRRYVTSSNVGNDNSKIKSTPVSLKILDTRLE